ncbi:MAG TPA: SDR family oxidoreductase [Bacteroidales bacterium]|jgi:NAD(P)-dependent dehydrogenase (short-subunit alcohol dehydrogenase family)|nr:SDR family oxidoreductase [Bacteroidales bacterium]
MRGLFNLSDKNILVTGASSGIGRSIAVQTALQGATLYLTARNNERLQETAELLSPGEHKVFSADLAIEEEIRSLSEKMPVLDGIVLNAGAVKTMPVQFIKTDALKDLFAVNIQSSIILIQYLLKKKRIREGASICFISSVSSNFAQFANSVYSATKGAVNSFSRSLALELAPRKIRVNAILPAFVETEFLKNSPINEEHLREHLKKFPLGRFGRPEDVAYLAVYLLSDESEWMTGSLLTIDGGYSVK